MEEYEPGMTAETLEAGTRGTGGQAWKEKADAQGLMPDGCKELIKIIINTK